MTIFFLFEQSELFTDVARHTLKKRDNDNSEQVNRVFNRSQSYCVCVTHLTEQTLFDFAFFIRLTIATRYHSGG
jgi:hypothetical protein